MKWWNDFGEAMFNDEYYGTIEEMHFQQGICARFEKQIESVKPPDFFRIAVSGGKRITEAEK